MNARSGLWLWWVAGCLLLVVGPALGAARAEGNNATGKPAIARLQTASVERGEDGLALRLEADADLTYKVFRLENPPRLVVDLLGVSAPLAAQAPGDVPGLRAVRYSLWKPSATEPIVRYVIETSAPVTYEVDDRGAAITVRVTLPEGLAAAPPRAEASAPDPAPDLGPIMVPLTHEPDWALSPQLEPANLGELVQMGTKAPISSRAFAALPTGRDDTGCTEVWGGALVLGAAQPPTESTEPAWPRATWLPSELAAQEEVLARPEERVATAAVPSDFDVTHEAAPAAVEEPAATEAVEEPAATETVERVATAELAGDSPPATATEPAAQNRHDRFDELIDRHRPAAVTRAQRDWSQNLTPHDRAPLLGDADADFPLATGGGRQAAPMSLDVQGADVHTVLRSIAEYAGVNIVADKDVTGRISLRALDLPWPDMLRTVCRAMGLVAIDHGLVIRVATERVAQEETVARESAARKQEDYMPLQTRIVTLRYAQAAELKDLIATMRGDRGKVEVDPRTNALILTDIEPRLDLLEQTLSDLDSQTMQVEITAEIVDVDFTAARQLGITWGVDNYHSVSANASGSMAVTSPDMLDPAASAQVGILRSFGEVHARIQALADQNKADIISTPRITTVNNREARILVGKEVPLITMDEAGNAITELKKVGITLQVTPYVNSEDQITLDMHPEVSDLSSQSTVQGGVVFTTTEADARVMVREGETAVIGGLIRTLEGKLEQGVPLLKDVPVLGQFFKYSDTRHEKRELLIFVTPRLVRAANAQQG